MVLNAKQTKCLPFISSETKDFMPELRIKTEDSLEVIWELKLVGLIVTSDLTWHAHVEYTVGRVSKILWQLTRFKRLGASQDKLITFYVLKIRSILMFGSVCFHSSISSELSQRLELQQKRCFAIILGSQYGSYHNAATLLDLPRLDTLRSEACLKWANKAAANPQHTHLFPHSQSKIDTRHKQKYKEYFCHSAKYYNSAVPHMTRLLNKQPSAITTNSGVIIPI